VIVLVNARGGGGIVAAQKPMQGRGASARERCEPAAKLGIARGRGRKPIEQGAEIEPGATRDNRKYAPGFEIAENGAGEGGIRARGEFPARLHDVHQMMRYAAPFPPRKFGRPDFEAGKYLNRVAIDDLAVQGLRQMKR
jgi:hypothetical protein